MLKEETRDVFLAILYLCAPVPRYSYTRLFRCSYISRTPLFISTCTFLYLYLPTPIFFVRVYVLTPAFLYSDISDTLCLRDPLFLHSHISVLRYSCTPIFLRRMVFLYSCTLVFLYPSTTTFARSCISVHLYRALIGSSGGKKFV